MKGNGKVNGTNKPSVGLTAGMKGNGKVNGTNKEKSVKENKKGCKCGSMTQLRATHQDCPLSASLKPALPPASTAPALTGNSYASTGKSYTSSSMGYAECTCCFNASNLMAINRTCSFTGNSYASTGKSYTSSPMG